MRKGWKWLATASAFSVLAACSGGDRNEQAAANEAAAENSAAHEQSNPFADAERKMNDAMMAAVGSDAGQSWAKKMIAHHQGAIDMSEIVLQQNPKPDVAMMARETIDKQKKDIADIEKLVKDGAADQKSAELYRSSMMDMHQKMDAATGADASELYMRKMLEHHKGAVAMSDVALQNGVSGALREQVQKTREDNQKDAKMVEAMLGGQSMQQAMKSSGAMTAAEMAKMPKPPAHSDHEMGNMDMNDM